MSHYPGKSCSEYCTCRRRSDAFTSRPGTSAPTQPPARADQETQAFETLIKKVGEGQARWTQLLTLLEEQSQ